MGDTDGDVVGSVVVGEIDGEVVGSAVVGEIDGEAVGPDVVGEVVGDKVAHDMRCLLLQYRSRRMLLSTGTVLLHFGWPSTEPLLANST